MGKNKQINPKFLQLVKATIDSIVTKSKLPVPSVALKELLGRTELRRLVRKGELLQTHMGFNDGRIITGYYTSNVVPDVCKEPEEPEEPPAEEPEEPDKGGAEDAEGVHTGRREVEESKRDSSEAIRENGS